MMQQTLSTDQIGKAYRGRRVVNGVTLHINQGEVVGLLGPIRKTRGYALSGGERRRVEIARCLCIRPTFILLDEPFSGIDPIAVLDLQKIIFDLKASGIGVLITDHNVRETLSVTDRAYIIDQGRILSSGTPQQLGNDPQVKRVYLGENFSLA